MASLSNRARWSVALGGLCVLAALGALQWVAFPTDAAIEDEPENLESAMGAGPGQFLWLDGQGTPTWNLFLRNASGGLATAGPPSFHRYDDWCRAYDTVISTNRYDTMPATFTGSTMVAKRYTIEYFTKTPWNASGLTGSNLQSFLVVVEGGQ